MEIDIICIVITWSISAGPTYEILLKLQDYVYVNREYKSTLQKVKHYLRREYKGKI